jgi:transposase
VDAHGMPFRAIITAGTTADCTKACALIDGIAAEYLLGDRGYDTDEIVGKALAAEMEPVIPPKKNRKEQRFYDKYIYKIRHLVMAWYSHTLCKKYSFIFSGGPN